MHSLLHFIETEIKKEFTILCALYSHATTDNL